jgi:CRP/FNR family transcriptional regulator, nitrogen oxide reductase regulator
LKKEYSQIIRNSSIFNSLDDKELEELTGLIIERSFPAGQTIFWEGDESGYFYFVVEGKIRISKLASTGKEIVLAFFGPGEMVGEVAVFENKPYPASAQSIESTRLLGIQKTAFMDFLMKHPQTALRIIAVLSGRLRDSQSRLRDLAGERVEQRLARMLLMLSAKIGPVLPFTRQEISDMAGTTTETTIRILSQWKDRGIVSSVRGKITIDDETKLKLLAEGPPLVQS